MRTTLISVLVLAILVGCKNQTKFRKRVQSKRGPFVTTVSVKKEKSDHHLALQRNH